MPLQPPATRRLRAGLHRPPSATACVLVTPRQYRLGIDSTGHAITVWHQSDDTAGSIRANRYTPGVG